MRGILFGLLACCVSWGATEPMVLETLSGKLAGTLELPETKVPPPVVLLIAGSGPTDRNGNSKLLPGSNNSLKMLAEALRAYGIASLRYDKRGIGESQAAGGKESDVRFDTFVQDAVGWASKLAQDKRFHEVVIAGHSEGSLIGMVAAQTAPVTKFISLEGAGRSAADLLTAQLKGKLPPELAQTSASILESLQAGKTVEMVPASLMMLYRPSVQPYLISWFRYDPAREVAKLKIPVLLVQGTTDMQASVADARRMALTAPAAKIAVIEGMNHILKSVSTDQTAQLKSYGDASLPLDPQLVEAVVKFIVPR